MIDEQKGLFDSGLPEQQRLDLSGGGGGPAGQETAVEPLDVPQRFAEASSFQVRDELEELVRRDLLGPWDGPLERFPPKRMGPRERYLGGMLGPKHEAVSTRDQADEVPDTESGVGGDASEVELPEVTSPQSLGRIWASSMGLSFCVPADVDVVTVVAEWGRYAEAEEETEDGKKARAWSREPVAYAKEVRLDAEPSYRIPLTAAHEDAPGVLLAVTARPRDGRRVVEISLINGQRELTGHSADTAWLFQSQLTVTALDGATPVFLPIDDPLDDLDTVADDAEELHLRLLYRNQRRYAAGRNIAVHADVHDGERVAYKLTTTWLPTYDVPATIAPTGPGTPLEHVELSMDALATAGPAALEAGLRPLVDGYGRWLDEREAEIPGLPEPLRPAATKAVYDARQAARRIAAGVTLLTDPAQPYHADALQAFHFANETMALQRRHTALAELREDEGLTYAQARERIEAQGGDAARWRPFQLAFILLNLPSLTDPGHPEHAADHTALVDLLFFPTGGGKTEAYLGLTAYTFAIRRLQGVIGAGEDARSGEAGVAVLMRYTLRLLTAQQFQRAAALICAAEVLRRPGDRRRTGRGDGRLPVWDGGRPRPARGVGRHRVGVERPARAWCPGAVHRAGPGTPCREVDDRVFADDLLRQAVRTAPRRPLRRGPTWCRGHGRRGDAAGRGQRHLGRRAGDGVPRAGVELWHWPAGRRTERGAKMHAKIAVGDRRELLVSSANLTQSGVDRNIEAGLVIPGGSAPQRAAEHIAALRSAGVLERL